VSLVQIVWVLRAAGTLPMTELNRRYICRFNEQIVNMRGGTCEANLTCCRWIYWNSNGTGLPLSD
jgi:hypothetical protein